MVPCVLIPISSTARPSVPDKEELLGVVKYWTKLVIAAFGRLYQMPNRSALPTLIIDHVHVLCALGYLWLQKLKLDVYH